MELRDCKTKIFIKGKNKIMKNLIIKLSERYSNFIYYKIEKKLTPKETEILFLISKSFKNEKIAEKLSISSTTVRSHVSSILMKLDAKNRVQAITKGVQKDIL